MCDKPGVTVLGAGARTGKPIADAFVAAGYNVAAVSRSMTESEDLAKSLINIKADFSDPSRISEVFEKTKRAFGTPPSIVIYTAWAMSTPKTEAWFSHDIAEMQKAYNTNTLSAFAAAREAVTGFETLPDSVPKMFIYVGNQQNVHAFPSSGFMGLGTGKSASAHWLWAASQYFAPQGYRFYFADERDSDGAPAMGNIDGQAHADFFLALARGEETAPWHATFVKGKGYQRFKDSIVSDAPGDDGNPK